MIGSSKSKNSSEDLSHEDFIALQRELNFYENMSLKAAKEFRVVQGKESVNLT